MTSFGSLETNGYRSDGLRAAKQSAASTTYFLYDGDDPVCELSPSGSVTAVNTFGGAGLLSRHTSSTNASTFYTFDERGNVAQRLDATGSPLSTDLYDAYGARVSTAAAQPDPFGFAGQDGGYTDAETGLVLCGHRYYDPAAGRFLNRDPAGYAGGLNLYAYCGGNPVTQDDPTGFNPQNDGGDGEPCDDPGMWYNRWHDFLDNNLRGGPPSIPGLYNNPLDVARGFLDLPHDVGHLGQGTGDFAANPSLQTAPGLVKDVLTFTTVVSLGAGAAARIGAKTAAIPPARWVLPENGGGAQIGDYWYTEHALERMAPDTMQVRAELEARAITRAQAEGLTPGTPEWKSWWSLNGPSPRGIPPTVVEAEIANPGSTGVTVITSGNRVIIVIPNH